MALKSFEEAFFDVSKKINIPVYWIVSLVKQESDFDPFAIRYEPDYKYLYQPESFIKFNSLETEIQSQKMSWGLGQIMGATAREFCLQGYLSVLLLPEVNLHYMGLLLESLMAQSSEKDDIFAMYNGGKGALHKIDGKYKNQSYVDSVNKHLSDLEKGALWTQH